jgi:thymidylate synthase (FAD)
MTFEKTVRPTNPEAEKLIGKYFPVLDHGFVSLVDYMGTDQCIEKSARVSYGVGTRKTNETRGLLRYLKRHLHSSPIEMLELKFHCCMPIFVARQWIRHRTANVNEVSGRYSLLPMMFYTPEKEQFQLQSFDNKQGRKGLVPEDVYQESMKRLQEHREDGVNMYEYMTQSDVARELARIDLPLSTYTQWYWKIDLRNLLSFLTLRVDSHAQWEIQEYGKVMAGMLEMIAPIIYEAWLDYDVCGKHFSHQEMQVLTSLVKADSNSKSIHTNSEEFTDFSNLLQGRELTEFFDKFKPMERPSFSLNLDEAKTAEYFEEKWSKG